jgi:hypothetical protein
MNPKQRIVTILWCVAMLVVMLCPPIRGMGCKYFYLFDSHVIAEIDVLRLMLHAGCVSAVAAIAFLVTGDWKQST